MDKDTVKPLKELLDSVRDIDGFPIGKDEDILAMSDPPFYTACPNPYIKEFIEEYGTPYDPETDDYHREPFVGDVSEGKNDEIYRIHTYHTKVPYKAVIPFIKHYTNPADIIFDGFCGSGMTGVAAGLSNRYSILSDLSPAASFISNLYGEPSNGVKLKQDLKKIYYQVKNECEWMYQTAHSKDSINMKTGTHPSFIDDTMTLGKVIYTIWSDSFKCSYCEQEFIYWDVAFDMDLNSIKNEIHCPNCSADITKTGTSPVRIKKYDTTLEKKNVERKQVPVLIIYSLKNERFIKKPDSFDYNLFEKIENAEIPYWYPSYALPDGFNTRQPIRSHGFSHVHLFYSKRNLWTLSSFFDKCTSNEEKSIVTSVAMVITKMYRFRAQKGSFGAGGGPQTGTLYIPSICKELSILKPLEEHINKTIKLKNFNSNIDRPIIQVDSHTDLKNIPSNSIDYIFTDPPFGSNIMYSELNFIWESWLKVHTNNLKEAIINSVQGKDINDYQDLMKDSFKEMNRILKPNRWLTVVFHNSQASIWNSIQKAMAQGGFIIAQVAVIDKKQGSFKQVTSTGAVKNDLVINAYKPKTEFSDRFLKNAGEGMEVDFVSQQLDHIHIRPNVERTEKMLYSKMLAHYVENGFKIKYNSTIFYKLLSDNFTELDGYWFQDSQVKEYNKWKRSLSLDELREKLSGQQVLFVSDEKSALNWMYYFLIKPRTYSDIFTEYQQVATTTDDTIPELKELLENNFILEDGKYRRPLSEAECTEVGKNREKELDRAFNKLLKHARDGKGKIKNVRKEALLHGFTKCYQDGRYQDILTVAEKLYKSTLESSGEIMDFIDIARIKTQGEKEVHAHE